MRFEPEDFDVFYELLENTYAGYSSYSVIYEEVFFRVERSMTMYGPQYCMRKMPMANQPMKTALTMVMLVERFLLICPKTGH